VITKVLLKEWSEDRSWEGWAYGKYVLKNKIEWAFIFYLQGIVVMQKEEIVQD
jgi:hypothetical protein